MFYARRKKIPSPFRAGKQQFLATYIYWWYFESCGGDLKVLQRKNTYSYMINNRLSFYLKQMRECDFERTFDKCEMLIKDTHILLELEKKCTWKVNKREMCESSDKYIKYCEKKHIIKQKLRRLYKF